MKVNIDYAQAVGFENINKVVTKFENNEITENQLIEDVIEHVYCIRNIIKEANDD
jgi:hypothetical protein